MSNVNALPESIHASDANGGILSQFTSIASLRDWLRIFLVGSLLETVRRFIGGGWDSMISLFVISAQIENKEICYRK
jgi:hypothetical protein